VDLLWNILDRGVIHFTRLLWLWFVSSIFQVGAPGVFSVAGLELVVFQFVRQFIPQNMRDWAVVKEFLGWTFVGPACFLAFGWVFKHFI
jgi:hypothetical protein